MANFSPGQIVTVFRSRLDPTHEPQYVELAPQIMALARAMPGFVEAKSFTADDGERVTVVTFEDLAAHRAWRDHAEHRRAQQLGRESFYESFTTQVCTTLSVGSLTRGAPPAGPTGS
jgi:heme-degrading monooxygenase HmoA